MNKQCTFAHLALIGSRSLWYVAREAVNLIKMLAQTGRLSVLRNLVLILNSMMNPSYYIPLQSPNLGN